jgi:hypothetical protein
MDETVKTYHYHEQEICCAADVAEDSGDECTGRESLRERCAL